MSAYGPLAAFYDALTGDVPYGEFAEAYLSLLDPAQRGGLTLLDLCCGTGTLTLLLAARGYEMIGVDASPDMLAQAAEKAAETPYPVPPMFLCQEAGELDLYGTVDGALCSLDGMNYLPPEELPELLHRLHLFIVPGGTLAFDFHSPAHLRELDGGTFVDEREDLLCLWRGEFDEEENALVYGMDIFRRIGALWQREEEEHVEYAHDPAALRTVLERSGFADVRFLTDGVQAEMGRIFCTAVNLPH